MTTGLPPQEGVLRMRRAIALTAALCTAVTVTSIARAEPQFSAERFKAHVLPDCPRERNG